MKGMNDYRRRDRIAAASLAQHASLMKQLMEEEGVTREEASRRAYHEMTRKSAERMRTNAARLTDIV